MTSTRQLLERAYRAFSDRDVDAVLATLHPHVNWSNAWEGGRGIGRAAVRDYWERQFAEISSDVEPRLFSDVPVGSVSVDVRLVVRDAHTHELVSDSTVRHRYRFEDGLIVRMDVLADDE